MLVMSYVTYMSFLTDERRQFLPHQPNKLEIESIGQIESNKYGKSSHSNFMR